MLKKHNLFYVICLWIGFFLSQISYAQNQGILDTIQEDDLGDVTDEFQDLFFQALTDRAIENYEKAIDNLRKAEDFQVNQAAVFFEMGKNFASLERFSQAENYFQKALKEKADDVFILMELEEVYRQQKQYAKAIPIVRKLTAYEDDYYESLAELYFLTKDYSKALEALDDLKEKRGIAESEDALRRKIYKEKDARNFVKEYLNNKIKNQPKNIRNYSDLIYVYQTGGEIDNAVKVAEKLQAIDVNQPIVHLAFYKKYLEEGKKEDAVSSMKTLINAEEIPNDIKLEVIDRFRSFVQVNPEFEDDLIYVLGEEISGGNQSNQQLAEFYINRDSEKALIYYQKALQETPNNLRLIIDLLTLQNKEKHYAEALELAEEKINIFPTQARLYLNKGIAENGLEKYNAAQESLLNGIDFVIDDRELERKFYKELATSFRGLNEAQKAMQYEDKASKLEE